MTSAKAVLFFVLSVVVMYAAIYVFSIDTSIFNVIGPIAAIILVVTMLVSDMRNRRKK